MIDLFIDTQAIHCSIRFILPQLTAEIRLQKMMILAQYI